MRCGPGGSATVSESRATRSPSRYHSVFTPSLLFEGHLTRRRAQLGGVARDLGIRLLDREVLVVLLDRFDQVALELVDECKVVVDARMRRELVELVIARDGDVELAGGGRLRSLVEQPVRDFADARRCLRLGLGIELAVRRDMRADENERQQHGDDLHRSESTRPARVSDVLDALDCRRIRSRCGLRMPLACRRAAR